MTLKKTMRGELVPQGGLADLAQRINQAHQQCEQHLKAGLAHALEAGRQRTIQLWCQEEKDCKRSSEPSEPSEGPVSKAFKSKVSDSSDSSDSSLRPFSEDVQTPFD